MVEAGNADEAIVEARPDTLMPGLILFRFHGDSLVFLHGVHGVLLSAGLTLPRH